MYELFTKISVDNYFINLKHKCIIVFALVSKSLNFTSIGSN